MILKLMKDKRLNTVDLYLTNGKDYFFADNRLEIVDNIEDLEEVETDKSLYHKSFVYRGTKCRLELATYTDSGFLYMAMKIDKGENNVKDMRLYHDLTVNLEPFGAGFSIDRTFLDKNNVPDVEQLTKELGILRCILQYRMAVYPVVDIDYVVLFQMEPEQMQALFKD